MVAAAHPHTPATTTQPVPQRVGHAFRVLPRGTAGGGGRVGHRHVLFCDCWNNPSLWTAVQVFPYLRKRFGFQNIANMCGNWYMPIYTWDKPVDNERMHAPNFKWKCDLMSSPDTNHEEECDQVTCVG